MYLLGQLLEIALQLAALVTHTGCLVCLNFYIHVMLPMLANFEAFWTQAQYGNRLCRSSIINRSSNFPVPLRLKRNKRILYPTNRNPGESPQTANKATYLLTYLLGSFKVEKRRGCFHKLLLAFS